MMVGGSGTRAGVRNRLSCNGNSGIGSCRRGRSENRGTGGNSRAARGGAPDFSIDHDSGMSLSGAKTARVEETPGSGGVDKGSILATF